MPRSRITTVIDDVELSRLLLWKLLFASSPPSPTTTREALSPVVSRERTASATVADAKERLSQRMVTTVSWGSAVVEGEPLPSSPSCCSARVRASASTKDVNCVATDRTKAASKPPVKTIGADPTPAAALFEIAGGASACDRRRNKKAKSPDWPPPRGNSDGDKDGARCSRGSSSNPTAAALAVESVATPTC